jgi:hypothetical protein
MQTENRHTKNPVGKERIEPADSHSCYLAIPSTGGAYARKGT